MKIVCYYPNWTYYRTGDGKYTVEDIDPSLCTHLVYAFAVLDPTTLLIKVHDSWLDIDLGNISKFANIKATHPHVKLLLGLGGWNDSRLAKYSVLLSDAGKRSAFVKHAVTFLREFGFDGLDLDYEYPGYDGVATDKEGFTALVKELNEAFKHYGWELTAAASASKATVDNGYEVEEVCNYLDAVHLMCYDMHGSWEQQVDHHAKLYGDQGDELTVDFAVNYWLSKGCPRNKMVVGIPTYGRTWTLSGSSTTVKSGASGPGSAGQITKESGFLAFHEVCQNLHSEGWTKVPDTTGRMGPYAYKANQWVGYDDPDMAAVKARYIVSNQLGGAMFWDLPSDDFRNIFGEERYPIIKTVSDILKSDPSFKSSVTITASSSSNLSSLLSSTASGSSNASSILSSTASASSIPTSTSSNKEKSQVTVPCQFQVKNQTTWPSHMQASLVVTLPADVTSYMLRVETDHAILKFVLWDADVEPATGQVFTVTNKHWFGGKKQGEVVELGFQMQFGAGEEPSIVAVGLV
eukprot:GFUD01033733.1.p1 GENE.GFUD01033733.1~~GFUD01033733.1.p1  ORF type:complete len:520 (+),score=153.64 GFUD01033733.1:169-1728(+)